ncbi:hypothetical protein OHV08_28125 [Streptomyces canus]|uniref:hypothetical protein n=1 Tax=Streptomyces canus TaxID=58343 RepID=UPI00324BF749
MRLCLGGRPGGRGHSTVHVTCACWAAVVPSCSAFVPTTGPGADVGQTYHCPRVIAALAVLAATAGEITGAATASAGTGLAAEKVFQSNRYVPRADRIRSAGPSGYLHAQEGRSGYLWTSYATGATTELGDLPSLETPGYLGSSSDVVTEVVSPTEKVVLKDMAAWTSKDVALTHGTYQATFGAHVLTQVRDADGNRTPWLYGAGAPADGTPVEGWPTGITTNFSVLGGDSTTAVLNYAQPNGVRHLMLVDLATGKVTGDVALNVVPTGVALSADRLVWWSGLWSAHVLDRADLSAPGTPLKLPGTEGIPSVGIAGNWLVVARSVAASPQDWADKSGERLMAVPLTGGDPITLLRHANTSLVTVPDGGLLAVGGTDSGDWALRRVTDTGAAAPTPTELTSVPPVAARIDRLSLQNGTLATDEADASFMGAYYTRPIAADGAPGTPTWQSWDGNNMGSRACRTSPLRPSLPRPDPATSVRRGSTARRSGSGTGPRPVPRRPGR